MSKLMARREFTQNVPASAPLEWRLAEEGEGIFVAELAKHFAESMIHMHDYAVHMYSWVAFLREECALGRCENQLDEDILERSKDATFEYCSERMIDIDWFVKEMKTTPNPTKPKDSSTTVIGLLEAWEKLLFSLGGKLEKSFQQLKAIQKLPEFTAKLPAGGRGKSSPDGQACPLGW